MSEMKSLIAYFSRKGNNYVGGSVTNLPVGNTEVAAKMIQKLTGSDIFRIATVKEYPADYNKATDVARQELRENARPELSDDVDNLEEYGVIYQANRGQIRDPDLIYPGQVFVIPSDR